MSSVCLELYQGDVLEAFTKVKSESVDLVVTSPPFNVGKDYGIYKDNLPFPEYYQWCLSWLKECYRVTKDGGRICLNVPLVANSEIGKGKSLETSIDKFIVLLKEAGYIIRETIIWVKAPNEDGNSFCGNNTAWGSWMSPSNPYCRSFTEFIIAGHKKFPKLQHEGKADISKEEFMKFSKNLWVMPAEGSLDHPAPFTQELPYRCMKFYSYIGDTVLDPFLGSGTTMKVAREIQRNCIGFELEPKNIQMIKSRVGFGSSLLGDVNFRFTDLSKKTECLID